MASGQLANALRYTQPQPCISHPSAPEPDVSLYPQHGSVNSPSKKVEAVKRKRPSQEGQARTNKKRTREEEDSDFEPVKRRRTKIAVSGSKLFPTETPRPRNPRPEAVRFREAWRARLAAAMNAGFNLTITRGDGDGDAPDGDAPLPASSEPAHLTQIDFLSSSLEFRKIIYRYLLVPTSKTIIFPEFPSRHAFRNANPELHAGILVTNWQVYHEARAILYGENKFVAPEPSRFFSPLGIRSLRPRTASMIKHLSLEKAGSAAAQMQESAEQIKAQIWQMMIETPAFLNLKKLTIRRQITRPTDPSIFWARMNVCYQSHPIDWTPFYKKRALVMCAAGALAYQAEMRRSAFHGLVVVEDGDHYVSTLAGIHINNVIEICLVRNPGPEVDHAKAKRDLHEEVLNVLWDQKESGVPLADTRFRLYAERYAFF